MIYDETTGTPTHTIEIFRGDNPGAEGEDFGIFFAGDVRPSDAVLSWLESESVTPDDPNVYALVVPAAEGLDNSPLAILPIAPAGDAPALVAEQDAARRPGRPSIADDGDTTRVSVTLPTALVRQLDEDAFRVASNRSRAIRAAIEEQVRRQHGTIEQEWPFESIEVSPYEANVKDPTGSIAILDDESVKVAIANTEARVPAWRAQRLAGILLMASADGAGPDAYRSCHFIDLGDVAIHAWSGGYRSAVVHVQIDFGGCSHTPRGCTSHRPLGPHIPQNPAPVGTIGDAATREILARFGIA
jgi:hypothetical protein